MPDAKFLVFVAHDLFLQLIIEYSPDGGYLINNLFILKT